MTADTHVGTKPASVGTTRVSLQIKYVVELASALAKHPAVYRVDLLTRMIKDPKVAKDYGQAEECILKPEDAENDLGGAFIVRLPCGPVDQYIRCGLQSQTKQFNRL